MAVGQAKARTLSQLLEATEHFYLWRQEKVAKIVQCGEHSFLNKIEVEATREGGLKFFLPWFKLLRSREDPMSNSPEK